MQDGRHGKAWGVVHKDGEFLFIFCLFLFKCYQEKLRLFHWTVFGFLVMLCSIDLGVEDDATFCITFESCIRSIHIRNSIITVALVLRFSEL